MHFSTRVLLATKKNSQSLFNSGQGKKVWGRNRAQLQSIAWLSSLFGENGENDDAIKIAKREGGR